MWRILTHLPNTLLYLYTCDFPFTSFIDAFAFTSTLTFTFTLICLTFLSPKPLYAHDFFSEANDENRT